MDGIHSYILPRSFGRARLRVRDRDVRLSACPLIVIALSVHESMISSTTTTTINLAPDSALTVENKDAGYIYIYIYIPGDNELSYTILQTMATHVTAQAHVKAAVIRRASSRNPSPAR